LGASASFTVINEPFDLEHGLLSSLTDAFGGGACGNKILGVLPTLIKYV